MQKQTIIVSVSNDLSNDQRVHRICTTLQTNGYNIIVIGRKLRNSSKLTDRNYQIKRFRLLFNKGMLFYANLNIRIFFFLLFHKADIYLSNDLDTLLSNTLVAKLKNKKLIYDSHELFTEVPELANSSYKKNFWLRIERKCIKKAYKTYTVCQSIADFYNDRYDINMGVIRNLPTKKDCLHNYNQRDKILIYQGALNQERGIEILIKTMQSLQGYKLIIAGKGYMEKELKELCNELNLNNQVIFTGNLDFKELHITSCTAKLGFSIEQGKSLNYHFALPNKIFDYIQAGVPFICSDFPEMKAVVEKYNVGEVLKSNIPIELAKQIEDLFSDNMKLNTYNNNCIEAAKTLTWENEASKLLEVFE